MRGGEGSDEDKQRARGKKTRPFEKGGGERRRTLNGLPLDSSSPRRAKTNSPWSSPDRSTRRLGRCHIHGIGGCRLRISRRESRRRRHWLHRSIGGSIFVRGEWRRTTYHCRFAVQLFCFLGWIRTSDKPRFIIGSWADLDCFVAWQQGASSIVACVAHHCVEWPIT